jgi:hypothetical protein
MFLPDCGFEMIDEEEVLVVVVVPSLWMLYSSMTVFVVER